MLAQLPSTIQIEISSRLQCIIHDFEFVAGGCINHGGKVTTSKGIFFLKWNSAEKYPLMFQAEAEGLKLLESTSAIRVPEVILETVSENFQFLILEFIVAAKPLSTYWKDLGEQLSQLHKNSFSSYGLKFNNYIGSLPQQNMWHRSWLEFFIEERLMPQLKLASINNKIGTDTLNTFDRLFAKLPAIIPEEQPSLLHGDLWSGNLIVDDNGNPCLIDPAVYYGHRETEIAFTQLFGGFDKEFYDSYQSNFPLEKGFRDRSDLYNLYPLMVHVNLFGGGYLNQVVSILRNYV